MPADRADGIFSGRRHFGRMSCPDLGRASRDVFVVVSTSAPIYPAAGLVKVAPQPGARVVIENPDSTPADERAERILRGLAGEIRPRLI